MTERKRAIVSKRSGFALIDVIFATAVFTFGVLSASGLLLRSARLSRSASDFRRASARVEQIADSLVWVSALSMGSQSFVDGRILWRPTGGVLHLQAWGADTAAVQPLLNLWVRP